MAHILVIEDDPILLDLYSLVLSDAGHQVSIASDGVIGLRVFERDRPEIVVTDLVMPNREGIETIRLLRQATPPPRIVAVSGAPQANIYLQIAARLGADRLLQKPFRNADLLSMVESLVPPAKDHGPLRFVVLDDDPDIAFLNRRQLEKAFPGCRVAECATPDQAFSECEAHPVDAVIADHHLHSSNGIEVVTRLRDRNLTCPIYMVTGSSDPEIAARAYAAGVTRVFAPGDGHFAPMLRDAISGK
ncbi:MAG TPA: response regulator [Opitutaceae bacterium]|jgi:CheY-like chemotaxis protein